MSNENSSDSRLARRKFIQSIGVGGIVAATGGRIILSSTSALAAQSTSDDSPEAFLANFYTQRAGALNSNNPQSLSAFYDTSSSSLLAFEQDRTSYMYDLGSRWKGKLLGYNTVVSLVSVSINNSVATVRLYETTSLQWIPQPRTVSSADAAQRKQDPEKFAASPTGSKGEITSAFGTPHELVLEKQQGGWRVVKDAYEEPDLHGVSPDLVPGSWPAVWSGRPSNATLSTGVPNASVDLGGAAPAACTNRTYNYTAAVSYAAARWNAYNSSYCNYNNCGGDCANFVSQCLRNGNEVSDGTWKTFNGGCGNCGTTASNAGSDTWANNGYLRSWAINSGRAISEPGITDLGKGDFVNYDWDGNGVLDHVAIVTDSSNYLVTCHNTDRYNVNWQLGGAKAYKFTWMTSSYCA